MAENSVACLVKIKTGEHIRAHIIVRPQFVIGRSAEADIPFVSSTVSRNHLRVELNKDSVTVTDLKSNNGSFIDGVPLQPERPIIVQGNNIIRLGSSKEEFTFQIIPVPMELMESGAQKETLLKNMAEVKSEAEKLGRKALEEERKSFLAQLKLEKEQAKLEFDKELDERRRIIDTQCRELLDSAKRKSDEMLTTSKHNADAYQTQSLQASLEKKKELESKILRLQEDARTLSERTRDQANAEAEKIIVQAKEEAKREMQSAFQNSDKLNKEIQLTRKQAELEAEKIITQAQENAKKEMQFVLQNSDKLNKEIQRTRKQADAESDKIILTAKAEAKKEIEAALRNSEGLAKEAQSKVVEKLKAADREAQLIIDKGNGLVEKMRKDAESELKLKSEDARLKAEKLLSETKSRIDFEVAEQKRAALDSVRAATLQEQEKIIKEYRGSIERLSQSKQTTEAQLKQISAETENFRNEHGVLKKQIEQMKTTVLEERHMLTEIQDELEEAQKVISRAENVNEEMKKAKEKTENMKAQYEKFKHDYDQGMRVIAEDLKASKEKSVLEFQAFKKRQEDEFAKSKLEAMEKLKTTIQLEENKYKQTLEMRSVEISRAIENRLLPHLESKLKVKESSLGGALEHIQLAVNEVILKEKPAIKAVTEHLGVDPEKEKQKKTRQKNIAIGAAAMVATLLAIFGEEIFVYLKENRSKYTEYLISQRTAESIYTPLQSDDWKETYTGNILYLRNYYEIKTDPIYEKQWALKLNDLELLRSMSLNEDDIIRYIGKEAALVRQLMELRDAIDARYLDEGLAKMNEVEVQSIGEIKEILKTDENYQALRTMERNFSTQYLNKKYGRPLRLPSESQ